MTLAQLRADASGCRWSWRGLWFAWLSVAALLVVARPAAAHPGCCLQCVNPHGETIPPAGSADPCTLGRLPTSSASNAGFNPDGFFQVGTRDDNGVCTRGTADVELFSCTGLTFDDGEFTCGDLQQIGDSTFENGTLIKYTEANGIQTPTVKPMGSNNGSGNPNGGAVEFHIKASGDLVVCSEDGAGCELCPVPPPPK
jgi:hypothetical protein